MPVACCQSPAHAGGYLPVAGACWRPSACHWHAPRAFHLSPACTNGLSTMRVAQWCPFAFSCTHQCLFLSHWHAGCLPPVADVCLWPSICCWHMQFALCQSLEPASGLAPVVIICWWTASCCQCMPVTCCLLSAVPLPCLCHWHVLVAFPLSFTHASSLLVTVMHHWPVSCCRNTLLDGLQSPAHSRGLLPVAGECWCPSACCTLVPVSFCLSLVHACSLLHGTGYRRCVVMSDTCCWHVSVACCLESEHAGGLPPVAGTC